MGNIITFVINALAVGITAYILPGVAVGNFLNSFIVAVVLAIANAFIRPVLLLLTLPLNILTLGLFTFVINAVMILIVAAIIPEFKVKGFWWALLFSLILSVVHAIFFVILK